VKADDELVLDNQNPPLRFCCTAHSRAHYHMLHPRHRRTSHIEYGSGPFSRNSAGTHRNL
jgi:hypothetical protein